LDISLIDRSAETVYVSRGYFGKNSIKMSGTAIYHGMQIAVSVQLSSSFLVRPSSHQRGRGFLAWTVSDGWATFESEY
jgi:hypothetical protein